MRWPSSKSPYFLRAVLAAALLFLYARAGAHVPVPESVLNPQTTAEAWNVLQLSTANVERLFQENRLAEIPDQISLCSPALRFLARSQTGLPQEKSVTEKTVEAAAEIAALAQASAVGDRESAAAAFHILQTTLQAAEKFFPPADVHAEIFLCPMHPDFLSADAATPCAKCGMHLVARRIPYSFLFMEPGKPSVRLSLKSAPALVPGEPARIVICLRRRDDSPVTLADLRVMHTQPIHLLIIDLELAEYHHEHPQPTEIPGEYSFRLVPQKTGPFRIFADLVPNVTGLQEYPFVDLPAAGLEDKNAVPFAASVARREEIASAEIEGFHFRLTSDQPGFPPRAHEPRALRVTITDLHGAPVQQLEPVMNAFAHLVGFYEDGVTLVHLHPAGGEITNPESRGGPALNFAFYPPKAGYLRLFCQVQIGGKMLFAPFGMTVIP